MGPETPTNMEISTKQDATTPVDRDVRSHSSSEGPIRNSLYPVFISNNFDFPLFRYKKMISSLSGAPVDTRFSDVGCHILS